MPAPKRQSESAALLSEIVSQPIHRGYHERAQAIWRLQAIVNRAPDDPIARLALFTGLMRNGQRQEALRHVGPLKSLTTAASWDIRMNLAGALLTCGDVQGARSSLRASLSTLPAVTSPEVVAALVNVAIVAGDVEFLHGVRTLPVGRMIGKLDALRMLEETGLIELWPDHQETSVGVVSSVVCQMSCGLAPDEDEEDHLVIRYHVPQAYQPRLDMARTIRARLAELYRSRGRAPYEFIGRVTTLVEGMDQDAADPG